MAKGKAKSNEEDVRKVALAIGPLLPKENGKVVVKSGRHKKMATEMRQAYKLNEAGDDYLLDENGEKIPLMNGDKPVLAEYPIKEGDNYVWEEGDAYSYIQLGVDMKDLRVQLKMEEEVFTSALRRAITAIEDKMKKAVDDSGLKKYPGLSALEIKFSGTRGRGALDISELADMI